MSDPSQPALAVHSGNTSKGLQPHWRQRHRTVKSLVPLRTWIFLRVPRRRRLKLTSLGGKFSLKLVPPGGGGQGTTRVLEVGDGATLPILLDEPLVRSVVPCECGWLQALSA